MPVKPYQNTTHSRRCSKLALVASALLAIVFTSSGLAAEKSFCFAMAESYYEQLYCEIQAKGEGKSLPAFYQFKNNNQQTQALLLKRPAAKIGVEVKAPTLNASAQKPNITLQAKQTPSAAKSPLHMPASSNVKSSPAVAHSTNTGVAGCSLSPTEIRCGQQRYQLLTNLHNKHLSDSALGPSSKMALPRFTGRMQDEAQVRDYLYQAYEQYLNQMRSIGLAGVTTRFGKFSYLFYDYYDKGLDFPNRFETLFHYLKKDKAALGVSERPADSRGMTLEQCAWLSKHYYVCEHGNNNLIYAAH